MLFTKKPPSSMRGRVNGPFIAMATDEVGEAVEMT